MWSNVAAASEDSSVPHPWTWVVCAGLAYAVSAFAVGVALGTIRVFFLTPRLGATVAVLLEAPVILAASWMISKSITRRLRVAPTPDARGLMGAAALVILIGLEFALGRIAFGKTASALVADYATVPGAIGCTAQLMFGLLPLVQGCASLYRADLARACARIDTGSRIVATRCGPVEIAEAGTGPAILLIHGAGGGYDQGQALANAFAPAGYRVIAMSRFGYLRTPLPENPSIAQQADAHAALLDALNVRTAVVVGISAGAPSALEFALRHGERCDALVLVVPGWFPAADESHRRFGALSQALFDRMLRSDLAFWLFCKVCPSAATRAVLGTPAGALGSASPRDRLRLHTFLWDILPLSRRAAGLALEPRLTMEPLSKPLDAITAPALVISAQDDLYGTWAVARALTRKIARARFIGYPTGGHLLVGHADAVSAAIADFLREASA